MTSTSKIHNYFKIALFLIAFFSAQTQFVNADETAQTLSVSPTLIQISVEPSQNWQSELRVFNVNDYDLEVFPQVVNFAPSGEAGQGEMLPIIKSETGGETLAEWVEIATSSILIKPQQTVVLPFSVQIPKNAAPGGHYAAILIGTKPSVSDEGSAKVTTAQFVTALLFTKVSGDVIEAGSIREFNVSKSLVSTPDVTFGLRFENTGNVHLQPQGDIRIFNMWGIERGVVPINYQTHFGNVLPNSIRKFDFTWSGENTLLDIGRYKAVVTLGYGDETKKFVTSTVYFWIIPLKQIAGFMLALILLLWFLSFAIKLYIKRMLSLAGLNPDQHYKTKSKNQYIKASQETVVVNNYRTVAAPVVSGLTDLVTNIKTSNSLKDVLKVIYRFIATYKIFLLVITVITLVILLAFYYVESVKSTNRPYNITIDNQGNNVSISSEQIFYNKLSAIDKVPEVDQIKNQSFTVEIINSSGVLGLGANIKRYMESYNYKIATLEASMNRTENNTVIVYNETNQQDALNISKLLGGALLSKDEDTPANKLKIYIGQDMKNK